jgi:hypothetical protein
MNYQELKKSVDELIKDCKKVLAGKGRSYSSRDDELANFKDLAKLLGIPPEQVCLVYLTKHIYSIFSIVKGEKYDTEGLRGRIIDAINYLILLNALHEDRNAENLDESY